MFLFISIILFIFLSSVLVIIVRKETDVIAERNNENESLILVNKIYNFAVKRVELLFIFIQTPILLIFFYNFWYVLYSVLIKFILSDNSIYIFKVHDAFWFGPAFFQALLFSLISLDIFGKIVVIKSLSSIDISKNIYKYINEMKKSREDKKSFYATYIAFILLIILCAFTLNSYVMVNRNTIIINTLFSFTEKEYSYQDVENIKVKQNYNNINEDVYSIKFKDGYVWNNKTFRLLNLSYYSNKSEDAIYSISILSKTPIEQIK